MFGLFKKSNTIINDAPVYIVTEGIGGTWSYHISKSDKISESLCGKQTMHTSIPLEAWNSTPENYHIPESWCKECRSKYLKRIT